ncbi:MAG TPA: hypothetical protein VEC16_06585 [Alphaproteobacteria bacterium]|nr:hypothetical protein [Alphaproteobacteria bacterium]
MDLKAVLNSTEPIGVDIDDVIIPFNKHSIPYVNKLYREYISRELNEQDIILNNIEETKILVESGISREKMYAIFKMMEADGIIENIMPTKECIDCLKMLYEKRNSKLYLVTARNSIFYKDPEGMTHRWLDKIFKEHGFKPLEIVFNHEKHKTLVTYSITTFIEDNLFNAEKLLEHGCNVILFSNPTNRINPDDDKRLSPEIYEKKRKAVEKIESYRNTKLFRIESWNDLLKNF